MAGARESTGSGQRRGCVVGFRSPLQVPQGLKLYGKRDDLSQRSKRCATQKSLPKSFFLFARLALWHAEFRQAPARGIPYLAGLTTAFPAYLSNSKAHVRGAILTVPIPRVSDGRVLSRRHGGPLGAELEKRNVYENGPLRNLGCTVEIIHGHSLHKQRSRKREDDCAEGNPAERVWRERGGAGTGAAGGGRGHQGFEQSEHHQGE